jgi:poly-gamma-glutamate capsule biosynthesis protein CapA/YwtB (metallophosphatase superfamily)
MRTPDNPDRYARRRFLEASALTMIGVLGKPVRAQRASDERESDPGLATGSEDHPSVKLFLCGDVMPGRGIDQILAHPSDPRIYEPYVRSAKRYVELAEQAHGPIPRGVDCGYVLGDVLAMLERLAPDMHIANLETAVTRSDSYWPGKGINYRMHPDNIDCLTRLNVDCAVLANNHVLDWGYEGLAETLATLSDAGIRTAGAGMDRDQAAAPAAIELDDGRRVFVFALGSTTSGIPPIWSATDDQAGLWLLEGRRRAGIEEIAARVESVKRPGDLTVMSVHWGANWGYEIPGEQRRLAHALIDEAGVDLVHGHSSHHPKGIEVHHGKLILYGCGDFLNDYEGISGHEAYRGDLSIAYLPELDPRDGKVKRLRMQPLQMRRFRLRLAPDRDQVWLAHVLDRECARLGTRVERSDDALELHWIESAAASLSE